MSSPTTAILTPCTGVCMLDPQGYCLGCHRTGAEIAAWVAMGEQERRRLMDVVLPQREAARARA
jgi:uncharacterized protein